MTTSSGGRDLTMPITPPTQGYWTPEGDPNRYEVAIKLLNEGTATSDAQTELLQVYLMHTPVFSLASFSKVPCPSLSI